MKFKPSNNYCAQPTLLLTLITLINVYGQSCYATEPASNTGDETKHFSMPFLHIDVKKHANGTKDVDVRAPFTNVHNPAGSDNAQVRAPFYKSEHTVNNTASNTTSTTTGNTNTGNTTTSNKTVSKTTTKNP